MAKAVPAEILSINNYDNCIMARSALHYFVTRHNEATGDPTIDFGQRLVDAHHRVQSNEQWCYNA